MPKNIHVDYIDAFNAGDMRKATEMALDLGIVFKRGEGFPIHDG